MIKRLLLSLLLLSVVAAAAVFILLRASLPPLEGSLAVHGLRGPVSIVRDAGGVPDITAANRVDLAFATGFVHGQDRYFQMDLSRRRAAGELAALFGDAAFEIDRLSRLHRFRHRAGIVVDALPGDHRAIAVAYAAGVNAGLGSLRSRPFEYLLLRTTPEPWLVEDSFLVGFSMFFELNDENASHDIRRGLAHAALPRALFDFLYPDGTRWDAPLSGAPILPPPVPPDVPGPVRGVAARSTSVDYDAQSPGSNNWAVAGALTKTGRAIVANDMHLGITVPGVFYRARLRVTGEGARDLNGVTLPGVPVLVAGSNGHIAWGNTNSNGDWTDAVILRPGAQPETYLVPEGEEPFTLVDEEIEVRGQAPVTIRIRESRWGPVVASPEDPATLLAISWLAHKPRALNLGGLALEQATGAAEALEIANRLGMPPQNFVVGDTDGNIGWTIAGQIPRRTGYDARLPADWSGGAGWTGWLPPDAYPRILNPDSGRLWTANARVVDGDALARIGDGGYDLGARARQIRDGLFARDRFVPADMLSIQVDDRALFLARWRDLLLATLDEAAIRDKPGRREYRAQVLNGSDRAAVDSAGYRLVRDFRSGVRDRVFDMLMSPVRDRFGADIPLRMSKQFEAPLWQLVNEQPAHLLSPAYASWHALLLQVVDDNLRNYQDNFAGPLSERTWGERNTARIRHPMSRALAWLSRWLDMPRDPLPGDSNLPRAQGPAFGAAERFAVAPGDEANGYIHLPSGQSGHPLSPFYRAGHADWVDARATPFLPGPALYTLTLEPRYTD